MSASKTDKQKHAHRSGPRSPLATAKLLAEGLRDVVREEGAMPSPVAWSKSQVGFSAGYLGQAMVIRCAVEVTAAGVPEVTLIVHEATVDEAAGALKALLGRKS